MDFAPRFEDFDGGDWWDQGVFDDEQGCFKIQI